MKIRFLAIALVAGCFFANAQKVSMQYNLAKGSVFNMGVENVSNIHQDVMGNAMDVKIAMNGKVVYTVRDVVAGDFLLDMVYEQMSMKIESPMMNLDFDSNGTIDPNNPLHTTMNAMIGHKFEMVMDAKGKVKSVKGFDDLVARMTEKLNGDKALAEQMANAMKAQFSDDALKASTEMVTAIFPDGNVAVGESWLVKTKANMGMELLCDNTYTLRDAKDGQWLVGGKANLQTNSSVSVKNNGMDSFFNMTGTTTTALTVDAKTGWVLVSKANQVIEGKVSLEGGQLPSAMEIPMKIEMQTTTTRL